jgi:hypothetical protein
LDVERSSDGSRYSVRVSADEGMLSVHREIVRKAGAPLHLTVALLNGGCDRVLAELRGFACRGICCHPR